jgi:NAD(P)-dependent dehydrogenase (short-subunit alcohol dehydrogenase family)
MAVNVTGSFLIAQAAAEMIGRPAGAIVLTASSGAELGGVGGDGRGAALPISAQKLRFAV